MDHREGILREGGAGKTRFGKNSVSSYSGNLLLCHPESIQPSSDSTITCIFLEKQLSTPSVCGVGNCLQYSWGKYSLVEAEQSN